MLRRGLQQLPLVQHHRSLLPLPPRRFLAPGTSPSSTSSSSIGLAGGDTIYALSTGLGRAAIAVYRSLCPGKAPPLPRKATIRTLRDDHDQVLDPQALVLFFPAPRTVTGQDVLELQVHGGPATVRAVLAAVPRCGGQSRVRYAEPGEFTRRAFFHGRLELAQVEALGDALAAETEQQRRAAVGGSSGALGRRYEGWRRQLLEARAELEALIDFSEDQHFDEAPTELLRGVVVRVEAMRKAMRLHDEMARRGELLRRGIRVALLGPPNVGKSSLMNLIVGREASIVSAEAGTTRDVVEAGLDLGGYLCSFADTAGFRDGKVGAVEAEGIRRARQQAQDAHVVVVMASMEEGGTRIVYDEETLRLASEAEARLIVVNKSDAVPADEAEKLVGRFHEETVGRHCPAAARPLLVSCVEEADGAAAARAVVGALMESFSRMTYVDDERLLAVSERQRQLLARCREHLDGFDAEAASPEPDVVLVAEFLRLAADCLACITGRVEGGDVEELLGVVFER
ncbi:hypothetical protein L249_5697 [Ophiocordyceps polyrhachis-furcata BCC 54312]|uniref:TrmE-type G domain-containing protein n=1 Tax=Ophiocordyceps polyrhachis-furcata BCC 54312 TaxID=1330021 RepID=A0A367KZV1_9HYPO|nr:hypothetical protein L249_5697 [Ophiocordyceps polyrhachis-furcata BCC 54312]